MENLTNEQMAQHLLKVYPPTNVIVLNRWKESCTDDLLKLYVEQWIEVVQGIRTSIDDAIFEAVKNKYMNELL